MDVTQDLAGMSESSFVNVNSNKQQDQRVTLEVQKWQVACDVRVLSNLKFTSVQISTTKELPRSDSIALLHLTLETDLSRDSFIG